MLLEEDRKDMSLFISINYNKTKDLALVQNAALAMKIKVLKLG